MSDALDRILRSIMLKSAYQDPRWIPHDSEGDSSLSFGDWRDSIGVELHTIKKSLEELAIECDEHEVWGTAAKIRQIAKDL